jgi:cyclophilin family peptidyl-prolyl cis-trans isomerase
MILGLAVGLGLSLGPGAGTAGAQGDDKHPVVVMDTSMGEITLQLDAEKAPITTENFLKYVDDKFFDGLIFHRVISDFMIQGGGLDEQLNEKSQGRRGPIQNESRNGLGNTRGTIAMARTPNPNSATCQFFINRTDNTGRLDRDAARGAGYAVFGKVISGMDVVDKIANVRTTTKRAGNGFPMDDVPVEPVVIKSVRRKGKG